MQIQIPTCLQPSEIEAIEFVQEPGRVEIVALSRDQLRYTLGHVKSSTSAIRNAKDRLEKAFPQLVRTLTGFISMGAIKDVGVESDGTYDVVAHLHVNKDRPWDYPVVVLAQRSTLQGAQKQAAKTREVLKLA